MAMSLVEIISAKKNFTSHVINEVSKTRIVATEMLNYSQATQCRAEMTKCEHTYIYYLTGQFLSLEVVVGIFIDINKDTF